MASFGGALIVKQHSPDKHILKKIISHLLSSNSLTKMKSNMKKTNFKNPENKIIEIMNSFN